MATDEPQRILLVAPNRVGDLVMATPAFRAIRARFPKANLTAMVRPFLTELVEGTPWFDRVIAGHGRREGLVSLVRAVARTRRGKFDLAVLFPNSFRSALVARLGGCKRLAGYDRDGRGWLLTERATPRMEGGRFVPMPTIGYYLELAGKLGAATSDRRMELFVSETNRARAGEALRAAGLEEKRPLVLLSPGASYGPSKCWGAERFAHVAELLSGKLGAGVGVICALSEMEQAREITKLAECEVSIVGEGKLGLGALKGAIERADAVITNDTGPRHIAAALGRAVVTIFGPTDPTWAEIGYERETAVRVETDCGPCQLPVCPKDHRCMTRIEPERVFEETAKLLGRS